MRTRESNSGVSTQHPIAQHGIKAMSPNTMKPMKVAHRKPSLHPLTSAQHLTISRWRFETVCCEAELGTITANAFRLFFVSITMSLCWCPVRQYFGWGGLRLPPAPPHLLCALKPIPLWVGVILDRYLGIHMLFFCAATRKNPWALVGLSRYNRIPTGTIKGSAGNPITKSHGSTRKRPSDNTFSSLDAG